MKKLTKAQLAERAAKVDRLGMLDAEIAAVFSAVTTRVSEAKALREEVAAWASESAKDQPIVFSGKFFVAVCSANKNERSIDLKKFRQVVGDGTFFSVASVPLGEADRLAKVFAGIPACIASDRTGKRTIDTHARVA